MSESMPEDAAGGPAGPSDAALISRVRGGDVGAYGSLYERHVASARGLARHLVAKDAEVDDIVAETFAKVLDLLRRGGGPESGFRPYLLTAIRRTAIDRFRTDKRLTPTGEIELYDPGVPFVDPALAGLERSMIAKAFLSLPERWQAVLWHTEIEGEKPADVGPLLGLTANGVAALAYRAREGLRQAYLQMHLAATPDQNCRPVLDKLGAYVRGGLAKRENTMVEQHLDGCADCKAIYAELVDVNTSLRTIVGPLFLGTMAAAYLGVAKGGFALGGVIGWFRHLPKRQQQALGGGATAAAAAAAVLAGLLLVSHNTKIPPHHVNHPAAAAPVPAPKPAPKPPAKPKPPAVPAPAVPVKVPPKKPPKSLGTPKRPVKPAPPAHLTAAIAPVGTLLRDHAGMLTMAVRNTGAGVSKTLGATVTLPPGVVYEGGASGRNSVLFTAAVPPGDGWSCMPVGGALRCTHAPVPPGGATSAYLHVDVAPDAPLGTPPRVTLRSGSTEVTATSVTGVVAAGLPARFAADGNLRTYAVGNALLSCDLRAPGCAAARQRLGDRRDDDDWCMLPLNLDDDPATTLSSSAALPLRGQVLWAGLYWSGVVADADSEDDRDVFGRGGRHLGTPGVIKVRAPGATAFTTVAAAQVLHADLPSFSVYQAFADATSLVQAHGGGQWWAADASTLTGPGHYAGWSLIVVTRDRTAPLRQAMVLDGAQAMGPSSPPFDVPIAGLLPVAAAATIHAVAWEGDADLTGDRLLLDGRPLTPLGGEHDPNNAFSSWSDGEIGPSLTFGTDVDDFAATLGPKSTLSLVTSEDAYLVGAIAITSPKQS